MLRDLRIKALATIADVRACLSTSGPGGLQASMVSCRVRGECLYLMVPASSDHLFNLEFTLELVLTTDHWQLWGLGVCLPQRQHIGMAGPRDLVVQARGSGYVLVEVVPLRIHLGDVASSRYQETIDFSCRQVAVEAEGEE